MNSEEWKTNRLGYDVVPAAFECCGGSGAVRMVLMLEYRASSVSYEDSPAGLCQVGGWRTSSGYITGYITD